MSCPTTTACFAIGSGGLIIETTNGSTWKHSAPNGTSTQVNGVSCPNNSDCFQVAGSQVFATTDGGGTWPVVLSDYSVTFNQVSCPALGTCFVVAGASPGNVASAQLFGTSDGGATWPVKRTLQSAETIAGISCPTTSICYAVSSQGNVWVTTDGWTTSHEYSVTANGLRAISCPTSTECFAIDNSQQTGCTPYGCAPTPASIFITLNGGVTWGLSFNIVNDPDAGAYVPFSAIDCPDANTCYAAGAAANLIAMTTDGGAHWRTGGARSSAYAISCPSANECFAVGQNVQHTTDFGATWDF